MKYARIENNKVMEIIDFDPEGKFTSEIVKQFVECPNDTEQSMIYENKKFKKYVHTETKEDQKQKIKNELEKSDKQIMKLIDELTEFCETKGFNPTAEKKNIIENRKLLRQQLSDLEN